MWRLTGLLILCGFLLQQPCDGQALRVTTWNLHDFPSGVYGLRKPEVEKQHTEAAADVLRKLSPDIIVLQEVRDAESCTNLAALISSNYTVHTCSAFRDRAGIPTFQQVAVLSRFPSESAFWENWHSVGPIDPPRGFAYAVLRVEGQLVAVYGVHLKSNVADRGNRENQAQLNILKRELAAVQLVRHVGEMAKMNKAMAAVIVAGDFNTNRENPAFVSENTLTTLETGGFGNCLNSVAGSNRVTCPGNGRYPDATFDYLFTKGPWSATNCSVRHTSVSDHNPVSVELKFKWKRTP